MFMVLVNVVHRRQRICDWLRSGMGVWECASERQGAETHKETVWCLRAVCRKGTLQYACCHQVVGGVNCNLVSDSEEANFVWTESRNNTNVLCLQWNLVSSKWYLNVANLAQDFMIYDYIHCLCTSLFPFADCCKVLYDTMLLSLVFVLTSIKECGQTAQWKKPYNLTRR